MKSLDLDIIDEQLSQENEDEGVYDRDKIKKKNQDYINKLVLAGMQETKEDLNNDTRFDVIELQNKARKLMLFEEELDEGLKQAFHDEQDGYITKDNE